MKTISFPIFVNSINFPNKFKIVGGFNGHFFDDFDIVPYSHNIKANKLQDVKIDGDARMTSLCITNTNTLRYFDFSSYLR